ncbi:ABC transporter permease subunit [Streptomyces albipurpureus]|uniref:ABC transporter permease n=1 Tax=Streptomyces albipurpureus TaxID=2897419 RepID=A0ABT0UXQ7_9ACTN|nr:ABC transporter permease subunit [Streptomyces sp. CWNU-1]MCM2393255.1 ABC transporter permease [Streptomyces sp. CWNU-1]
MTTQTQTITERRVCTTDLGTPARFRDLLAAEWIKLWSLRSSYWALGGGALTVIGINVNSARSNADRLADQPPLPPAPPPGFPDLPQMVFDPLATAFVDPAWQLLMVIAGSVGAIAVFGEYTSGLIRTTFAAVPARRAVMTAKATVLAVVMLALGAVVAGTSFGVTQAILRDHNGLSLSDPGALRAVAASTLLAPLCAFVGMALGALIRHAAGTVAAVAGVLLLLPALFQGETYRWVAEIGDAMPLTAWNALVQNPESNDGMGLYPVSVTEAWSVFGGWSLVAVIIAVTVVHRRDV